MEGRRKQEEEEEEEEERVKLKLGEMLTYHCAKSGHSSVPCYSHVGAKH